MCSAAPADQQITVTTHAFYYSTRDPFQSLPNLTEPFRSKHYAGYLDIAADKQLFYWYV